MVTTCESAYIRTPTSKYNCMRLLINGPRLESVNKRPSIIMSVVYSIYDDDIIRPSIK